MDAPLRDNKSVIKDCWPLSCPCGRPLDLMVVTKVEGTTTKLEFAVGHYDVACSVIVHGKDLGEILGLMYANARETGKVVPSAEEYVSGISPKLLEVDRTDPSFYGLKG